MSTRTDEDGAAGHPTDPYAARRYELDRTAAAIGLAEAATDRLRTMLKPGTANAVASMLRSDLEQASARVDWLRERFALDTTEAA